MDKLNHPINLNDITPEQAIQGTIEMWSDMKDTLRDTPDAKQHYTFKIEWLREHGYTRLYSSFPTLVSCECFLCECAEIQWARDGFRNLKCQYCPICWPKAGQGTPLCRSNIFDYTREPISKVLVYVQDKKNRRIDI